MAIRNRSSISTKPPAPTPTYWIEHTPDGAPPADVLLVLLGIPEDEEAGTTIAVTGFYSSKLGVFLDAHNVAIEQEGRITHYHILELPGIGRLEL